MIIVVSDLLINLFLVGWDFEYLIDEFQLVCSVIVWDALP